MKKLYFFLLLFCAPFFVKAQCFVQVQTMNATCFGACDGSATAFPAGGTSPYTYNWMPGGQTTQMINGLCAGTYTVTVTDSTGCTTSAVATVAQPSQIVVSLSVTNASCSSCCDGNIVGTASGGTPPYFYMWSPSSQTTPVAQSLCPGTYTLCVTDANGCVSCNSATVNFPTGITEHETPGVLSAFPNPAINSITIRESFAVSTNAEITVYNILGESFCEKKFTGMELNETINLSVLPQGIYFVAVKTNSGTSVQRFIRQ